MPPKSIKPLKRKRKLIHRKHRKKRKVEKTFIVYKSIFLNYLVPLLPLNDLYNLILVGKCLPTDVLLKELVRRVKTYVCHPSYHPRHSRGYFCFCSMLGRLFSRKAIDNEYALYRQFINEKCCRTEYAYEMDSHEGDTKWMIVRFDVHRYMQQIVNLNQVDSYPFTLMNLNVNILDALNKRVKRVWNVGACRPKINTLPHPATNNSKKQLVVASYSTYVELASRKGWSIRDVYIREWKSRNEFDMGLRLIINIMFPAELTVLIVFYLYTNIHIDELDPISESDTEQ